MKLSKAKAQDVFKDNPQALSRINKIKDDFVFIDIILESLFSFYLFEKYFFYIVIISSILGLIFGLASITDIPEDKKN